MGIDRKKRRNRSGYVLTEAAILVPVFLMSVLLLVYLLKMMQIQEIVHFESAETLVALSWESQATELPVGTLFYESRINRDVAERTEKNLSISAELSEEKEVLCGEISFPVELELPFGLFDDAVFRDVLVMRKWSGEKTPGEGMDFAAMTQKDSETFVFVFPKYGERFHRGDCMYLSMDAGRYLMCISRNEAAAKGFSACHVCYK